MHQEAALSKLNLSYNSETSVCSRIPESCFGLFRCTGVVLLAIRKVLMFSDSSVPKSLEALALLVRAAGSAVSIFRSDRFLLRKIWSSL